MLIWCVRRIAPTSFDAQGQMIAQAESIPVHLGAMPYSVAAAIAHVESFSPGDVVVLNDPYSGGAHLPDVTFVAPVFIEDRLIAFVANRAHHADVGGKEPGSLAGDTVEIYQEGLRIPPIRLWEGGVLHDDLLQMILANVRTPEERWGDLRAQKAGCVIGIDRIRDLCQRIGESVLMNAMTAVLDYSDRRMRHQISLLPQGEACFEDVLDNDGISEGSIPVRVWDLRRQHPRPRACCDPRRSDRGRFQRHSRSSLWPSKCRVRGDGISHLLRYPRIR